MPSVFPTHVSRSVVLGVGLLAVATCGCSQGRPGANDQVDRPATPRPKPPPPTLAELRRDHPTQLTRFAPAPSTYEVESPPPGVKEVLYASGPLQLKAWFATPPDEEGPHPAVVYFHSGHAFGASDFEEARLYLEAGFAVMTPMLRGENGNPGDFEMLWGELDDAVAAIRWLSAEPTIDADRIYAFGHSMGGAVSALLALAPEDLPLQYSGSAGGLYPPEAFEEWADQCPFDPFDPDECKLRTLLANVSAMQRHHYAYVGIADPLHAVEFYRSQRKLHRTILLGDHFSSLRPAAVAYLRRIHKDAFGAARPLPDAVRPLAWKHPRQVAEESVLDEVTKPEIWQVEADPYPGELTYYRDDVRCPVQLVEAKRSYMRGYVDFPYEPQPLLKWTDVANVESKQRTYRYFDLATLQSVRGPGKANFEFIRRHAYGYSDDRDRLFFHWPARDGDRATGQVMREGPGGVGHVVGGNYCVSPGGRYVAAFLPRKQLIVWESATMQVAGRVDLPELSGLQKSYYTVPELGFAHDGREFAAVVGTAGDYWLLNWHWPTATVTACFPTKSPWGSSRDPSRSHRTLLQFLEDGQGWMTEMGRTIIDRKTGQRRYAIDDSTYSKVTPRLIAGGRALGVWQDRADLFHHEIRTFSLTDPPQ